MHEFRKADAVEELLPDAVDHGKADARAIVRGVDHGPERPLACRTLHDRHHRPPDGSRVGIRRVGRSERLLHPVDEPCLPSSLVIGGTILVFRMAGMNEVVRALGVGAGHHDRGL